MLIIIGRGGSSVEYYYSRGGTDMRTDRTLIGGHNYDGEAEQMDGRRRFVSKRFHLH